MLNRIENDGAQADAVIDELRTAASKLWRSPGNDATRLMERADNLWYNRLN
jgi:hypothetical protein